jgi:hypothetical protein
MGFDIETTTLSNKNAYMYVWQFAINDHVIMGRSWIDFVALLNKIKVHCFLSPENRVIIWVANLGFEFQFMRKWLNITDIFAKEMREPLFVVVDNCIEFRDCLAVSGGSLSDLAKMYTTTQKMVGDLDYSKIRNNQTELTSEELQYCINDVKILSEWARYIFDVYAIKQKYIPLTKTAILRHDVKKGLPKNAKTSILTCFPDYDLYKKMMTYAFMGGITHANRAYCDRVIIGSSSVDITSSYPASMLKGYYPVSPFKKQEYFPDALNEKCCLIDVTIYNLEATTTHSILSKSKTIELSPISIVDNGRLLRSEWVRVFVTEIDFKLLQMYYKFDRIVINEFLTASRGKLPSYLIDPIFKAYETKTRLKRSGKGKSNEYKIAKAYVNSGYGMTVTRMVEKEIIYFEDSWAVSRDKFDFEKEVSKQFLLPQWGVWVTAHSRYALLSVIRNFPDDVIYYDTDSIKFMNYDKNIPYINEYNKNIGDQIKKECDYRNYDFSFFDDLGQYDTEYQYADKFKTLGAKRYIYTIGDDTYVTIAGLPKNTLQNFCKRNNKDIYSVFTNGMMMAVDISGKKTTSYNDEYHTDIVDGISMYEKSSVGIYDIPFTMTLDKFFMTLIKNQKEDDLKYEQRSID